MDEEVIEILKHVSLESLIVAGSVFGLTMLIKWPIKKATSKLVDTKRKAVNTVIWFIPIILSFVGSILYYGLLKNTWFNFSVIETGMSALIMSLSMYTIYERVVAIVKGVRSGKVKVDAELTKEVIKTTTKEIKNSQKQIKAVKDKLDSLFEIKNSLVSDKNDIDIVKLVKTNIQIQQLKNEEKDLQTQIDNYLN